jgi:hypothetical protein
LCNALLDHGIAEPRRNPFPNVQQQVLLAAETDNLENNDCSGEPQEDSEDDLLEPDIPMPPELPEDITVTATATGSTTTAISTLTNEALDSLIMRLRMHNHRAGISMLDGMLRRLGHRVQRERIRESLMRVDPVRRVFERICIWRRTYSVPGPNALWHHDGQHGKRYFCYK